MVYLCRQGLAAGKISNRLERLLRVTQADLLKSIHNAQILLREESDGSSEAAIALYQHQQFSRPNGQKYTLGERNDHKKRIHRESEHKTQKLGH